MVQNFSEFILALYSKKVSLQKESVNNLKFHFEKKTFSLRQYNKLVDNLAIYGHEHNKAMNILNETVVKNKMN